MVAGITFDANKKNKTKKGKGPQDFLQHFWILSYRKTKTHAMQSMNAKITLHKRKHISHL